MLKLAALSRMGLKEYDEALQAWKLCFEQCLIMNDDKTEIYIYEQFGLCYFYLGDLVKAEYFSTRFQMGIIEE